MKTESGSTRMLSPKCSPSAPSHVQAESSCDRSAAGFDSMSTKATTAPANATVVDSVASQPAVRREMRVPARVRTSVPASGATRQIQAPAIIGASPAERCQAVDVEWKAPARHRHDQAEADDDLGGGDGHHGD